MFNIRKRRIFYPLNVTKEFTRGKMPRPFLSGFSSALGDPQCAMVFLSTHLLVYFSARSLSAYLKQSPLGKIPLHTMRQDLAKGLVMARSRILIPPEMSFYPVFRQTPRAFLLMPTSAERLLARQKQNNSDTAQNFEDALNSRWIVKCP